MNFPAIVFKYLGELVKETRNDGTKSRKWIPLGSLIFDVLVESNLVETMQELNMTKEIVIDVGKVFNGIPMKNMSLISDVTNASEVLDKDVVSSNRILIDDYPIFPKVDPPEILEAYISNFLASGITPDFILMMNFQMLLLKFLSKGKGKHLRRLVNDLLELQRWLILLQL